MKYPNGSEDAETLTLEENIDHVSWYIDKLRSDEAEGKPWMGTKTRRFTIMVWEQELGRLVAQKLGG